MAAGDLEGAVALYDGPFLDRFSLEAAGEFDAWAITERARLAAMYEDALEQLATSAESRGAPEKASEHWRALAAVRPTDGRIVLRLLESLVASGDSAAALAHAAAHTQRLCDELGANVDPPFASRVAALRRTLPPEVEAKTVAAPNASTLDDDHPIVAEQDLVPTAMDVPRDTWFTPKSSRRALAVTLGSVVLVVLAATLLVGLTWNSGPARLRGTTAATMIAVAPFDEVGTVSHEVRDGLATLITANLDQVDELRLVPAAQVAARAHDGSATTSPAALLQSLHAERLITGVVVPAPEGIAVTTRIVDRSGTVRAMGEARGSVANLATLVDHISLALLRDLWGRRWGVPAPRLAAVVTPSAPALRAYLRGEMFLRAALWDSAAAEFASAIDQDSTFALAHLRIAEPYGGDTGCRAHRHFVRSPLRDRHRRSQHGQVHRNPAAERRPVLEFSGPANRVVAGECRPSGSLRYVSHIDGVYGCGALPARNSFPHTDSFRWYVTDGRAVSDVVTGNIRVEYVNMPPTSVGPASASTSEDTPASFTLSGLDPDGDPFAYLVNALPRHGSLRVLEGSGPRQITAVPTLLLAAADGTTSLQYVPDADFNTLTQGDDFHSQLTDGSVPRNCDYTVRFDVAPVNDAPGGIGQPTGVYGIAVTDDARPTDVLSIPLRAQGAAAGGIDIVDPSGFALRRVSATQVQFDGTLTAINALLDRGVQFTPNGSGATYGELAIIVDDRGNFGSGGPRVGTQIVAVDVGSDGDGGLESIRDGARATTRRPPLARDRR